MSKLTRDPSQRPIRLFSDNQVKTLFRERPDIAEYCQSLYAEEVKSIAKIRKSTVDKLEALIE